MILKLRNESSLKSYCDAIHFQLDATNLIIDMKIAFYIISLFVFLTSPVFSQDIRDVKSAFEGLYDGLFSVDEPGGSVLVMKGDKVTFLGNYGLADLSVGEKITEHTVFNTGSISKTFVANAILMLHERNQLSITDPISKYFDDFDNSEIAESVTIEHLLSHTSGLPDLRNVRNRSAFFLTAKDEENWAPIKKASRLNSIPGSHYDYSNPAFNGLALIIEKVTGDKWQQFVNNEIFKVADMESSTITDGAHPQTGVAHGYDKQGTGYIESDYGEVPTFAAAGNGGVWSTVMELAKYEKALRSHNLISKRMLRKSRHPFKAHNWNGGNDPHIGYSWFLDGGSRFNKGRDEVEVVYHTGSQGGFRSFFISIPEKDIVYIALFNRPFSQYQRVMEEGVQILRRSNWME